MSTVFEVNGPAVGPVEPHDTIKWTSAMETALLKMARQAQFDFDKVSKGMKAAVQRGLVACDAPSEVAEKLTVKACRLKFAALDRILKAAAKLVVASTPLVSTTVHESIPAAPSVPPVVISAAEILETSPSSVEAVVIARADVPVAAAGSAMPLSPDNHSKESSSAEQLARCEHGSAKTSVISPTGPDGALSPLPVKPVADLLTSFEAPLYRNYVKAPRLPNMADADDDDGEDSGIAASMTKPLTRDQIWAKVAARYSTLASRR